MKQAKDMSVDEAATQLASWLLFRIESGESTLEEAFERGLPGSLPGKPAFLAWLGKPAGLASRTEPELAARLARNAWFRTRGAARVRRWRLLPSSPTMVSRWEGLPLLHHISDLAAWLGDVPFGELDWLAGVSFRETDPNSRRGHYTYRWNPRTQGPPRLIASPKPRLKAIQHHILHQLLDHVPMHEAAHGFRAGHSIRTFAEPHVGRTCVLRADLADFFPSIRFGRVAAFFETAGYPDSVASQLAGLCCHSAPRSLIREAKLPTRLAGILQRPHLPQGAPTSPALSNAIAYRLDRRLAGLATAAGAHYTRYADDLAFSGGDDLRRSARRFLFRVADIVLDEGFELNYRKTRVMPSSVRQRLAGVVVNEKTNSVRSLYDELKAILHRWETRGWNVCAADDPAFSARLLGRISALAQLNPEKGAKLRERYDCLESRSG
jgi:RNA-directed DNA polymerase